MKNPSTYAKAIVGAATATAAAAIGNAMADGNLTINEAIASLGLGLVAGAAVYFKRNTAG